MDERNERRIDSQCIARDKNKAGREDECTIVLSGTDPRKLKS